MGLVGVGESTVEVVVFLFFFQANILDAFPCLVVVVVVVQRKIQLSYPLLPRQPTLTMLMRGLGNC